MKPWSSLPCSQQPTTCPLHKQGESNLHFPIISSRSILILFPWTHFFLFISFLHFSTPKQWLGLFYTTSRLYVVQISFLFLQPPEYYMERPEMKFPITQPLSLCCHFIPLRPKYLPQNYIQGNSLCFFFRNVTINCHTDTNQRKTTAGCWSTQKLQHRVMLYSCNKECFILTK